MSEDVCELVKVSIKVYFHKVNFTTSMSTYLYNLHIMLELILISHMTCPLTEILPCLAINM